jgi:hypothetical protein
MVECKCGTRLGTQTYYDADTILRKYEIGEVVGAAIHLDGH